MPRYLLSVFALVSYLACPQAAWAKAKVVVLLDGFTCDGNISFESIRVDRYDRIAVLGHSTGVFTAKYRFSNVPTTWLNTSTPRLSGACKVDVNGVTQCSRNAMTGPQNTATGGPIEQTVRKFHSFSQKCWNSQQLG